MAHKSKMRTQQGSPEASLPRIEKARREDRFQYALELARQLYKHEPTQTNLDLLRQVTFERGQQLEAQAHAKEAATVYANAADMGGPDDFRRLLIERLAACGAAARATALAQTLGDARLLVRVQGFMVDAAFLQGPGGRAELPAEQHADHDAVCRAFALAEAGRDEEARAALQGIGLQSPFLEWRVFLRGLLAYYGGDDARAVENWQRLEPQRLPARLAAPFRFGIDADYRIAQPPATQTLLQQKLDALRKIHLVGALRRLQPLLSRENKLAQAFRQAEALLPALRQEFPDLAPRLAACFRWSIIQDGQPEDLDRFERVFGAPADDPTLSRLAAVAQERRGMVAEAQAAWLDFEKEVAENPSCWPGDQGRHVRALVLTHAGALAMNGDEDDLDSFPFAPPRRRLAFKASTETCLRRSLKLAPEMLETHSLLLGLLVKAGKTKKALQAGKNLLDRFPDHALSLQIVASVAQMEGQLDDALTYLERALRVNPLDHGLRQRLVNLHLHRAREFCGAKQFEQARAECQAAFALSEQPGKYVLMCVAAVIELKAKNEDGYQQFLEQARGNVDDPLAIAYTLLCEVIRQKLPAAHRKASLDEFHTRLQQTLAPAQAARLAALAGLQRDAGPYHGQKSHEKQILTAIGKQAFEECPEDRLEILCVSLDKLEANKLVMHLCGLARKRFAANPVFLLVGAERQLKAGNFYAMPQVRADLTRARKLIEALPRGERQQAFLQTLTQLETMLRELGGGGTLFDEMMDQFGDFPFDDDEDDDYEDDDDF